MNVASNDAEYFGANEGRMSVVIVMDDGDRIANAVDGFGGNSHATNSSNRSILSNSVLNDNSHEQNCFGLLDNMPQ